jgi:drug/metabolite transporter (DMT)-like permease
MVSSSSKGYLCVVAAAVMWASSGTTGKALFSTGVTPFEVVQVRATLGALLLGLALAFLRRDLFRIRLAEIGHFIFLGGVVTALVHLTYFYAISKLQVAAAILLQYMGPIFVALFSMIFWDERPSAVKVISLSLSFVGCYLVVGGYNLQLLHMNRIGILWGLAAAVCYAAYSLLAERFMHRYRPWTVLFYTLVFAALSWHIFYSPFHYLRAGYTANQWAGLCYISVFGTAAPFGLYFVGINYIRSTRAAITAYLEPISAGFIAYLFLGETLEPLQILGAVLVIGAVVLLQLKTDPDELTPEMIRNRAAEAQAPR